MNHRPITTPDIIGVTVNTPVSFNVLDNDSDPDGNAISILKYTVKGYKSNEPDTLRIMNKAGHIIIHRDGSGTFYPANNYTGVIPQVTYTVMDTFKSTRTGKLIFKFGGTTVETPPAENNAPVALSDVTTTVQGAAKSGNVLTNDTDVDGNTLSVTAFTVNSTPYSPGSLATVADVGTFIIYSNGNFLFTPDADYFGAGLTVTYTISDGQGGTASASWSCTVSAAVNGFSLSAPANVSLGIYRASDPEPKTLLRTIYSVKRLEAGDYTIYWDGLDDDGNDISGTNDWEAKYVASDITDTWARIGNSSSDASGNGVMRGYSVNTRICIVGNKAFYGKDWDEGSLHVLEYADLDVDPNVIIRLITVPHTAVSSEYLCANSTYLFYGGEYAGDGSRFVAAINLSDLSEATLPGSSALDKGHIYHAYASPSNTKITGLACDENYLWIARGSANEITVVKLSDGSMTTVTGYTNPRELAYSNRFGGRVWFLQGSNNIVKGTVNNSNGQITTGNLTLTLPLDKVGLFVNDYASNAELVIMTGGTDQRVYGFDVSAGTPNGSYAWVMGQAGGYTSTAVVADDRFNFADNFTAVDRQATKPAFGAVDADQNYYIGDIGSFRMQVFDSSRVFQYSVLRFPFIYSATVNSTDATMCFVGPMRFTVDVSTGVKTFDRNYRAQLTTDTYNGWFGLFTNVFTAPNAKVYATVTDTSTLPQNKSIQLVELTDNGITYKGKYANDTGQYFLNYLDKDFNKWRCKSEAGSPFATGDTQMYLQKGTFNYTTGDWGAWTNILNLPAQEPGGIFGYESFRGVTDSGVAVFLDRNIDGAGVGASGRFHIWGVDIATNRVIYKTYPENKVQYRGPWPGPDFFEQGNTVNNFTIDAAGVIGEFLFISYHGEFWKSNQTNYFPVLHAGVGLWVDQFGTSRWKEEEFGYAQPKVAGNCLSFGVAQSSDKIILVGADEGSQGAGQYWKFTGFDDVTVNTVGIPSVNPEVIDGDLQLDEVTWDATFANTGHITRSAVESGSMSVKSAITSALSSKPEMCMRTTGGDFNWTCVLHPSYDNSLKSWKLTAEVCFMDWFSVELVSAKNTMIQILDDADKIISEVSLQALYNTGITIKCNDVTLATNVYTRHYLFDWNTLTIETNSLGSRIELSDLNYIFVPISDGTAHWNKPTKLKVVHHHSNGGNMNSSLRHVINKYVLTNEPDPTLLSAVMVSSTEVLLTFDRFIQGDETNLILKVNSVTKPLSSSSIDRNTMLLNISTDVLNGEIVTLEWTGSTIANSNGVVIDDTTSPFSVTNDLSAPSFSMVDYKTDEYRYDGTSNSMSVSGMTIAAGDTITVVTRAYTYANISASDISDNAGGNTFTQEYDDGDGVRIFICKNARAKSGYQLTVSEGGFFDNTLLVIQSRGLNNTSPLIAVNAKTSTGTANITSNSFSTTHTNEVVFALGYTDGWNYTWDVTPSGYTNAGDSEQGRFNFSYKWFTSIQTGITATSGTAGHTDNKRQFIVRLKLA